MGPVAFVLVGCLIVRWPLLAYFGSGPSAQMLRGLRSSGRWEDGWDIAHIFLVPLGICMVTGGLYLASGVNGAPDHIFASSLIVIFFTTMGTTIVVLICALIIIPLSNFVINFKWYALARFVNRVGKALSSVAHASERRIVKRSHALLTLCGQRQTIAIRAKASYAPFLIGAFAIGFGVATVIPYPAGGAAFVVAGAALVYLAGQGLVSQRAIVIREEGITHATGLRAHTHTWSSFVIAVSTTPNSVRLNSYYPSRRCIAKITTLSLPLTGPDLARLTNICRMNFSHPSPYPLSIGTRHFPSGNRFFRPPAGPHSHRPASPPSSSSRGRSR